MNTANTIYAFDFDGVICDSAIETAITAWKAAQTVWEDMPTEAISKQYIQQFRLIRPLLETGYEAILIVRLLQLGCSVDVIKHYYTEQIEALIHADKLDTQQLKTLFGQTRDSWIQQNQAEWLRHNPLFTGMAKRLQHLQQQTWYIITTKQERFVKQILAAHAIHLADTCIFGMDYQLNKQQVLQQLLQQHPKQSLVFVEDRLATLLSICQNSALQRIHLQLAQWGYNSSADIAIAQQHPDIVLLDLPN